MFQVRAVMMTSIKEKKPYLKSGISKDKSLLKGTVFKEKRYRTCFLELELDDELLKYYLNISFVNNNTAL